MNSVYYEDELPKGTKPKPKPTTDNIRAARICVDKLAENSRDAAQCLLAAQRLFEQDASSATLKELGDARTLLAMLRRTQTAALENIDAAIASAKGKP